MTQTEQQNHFEKMVDRIRTIMLKKGNDYAGIEDRLNNFKTAGNVCGLTAEQNCLSLIATKVARLSVLLKPGAAAPNNESIADTTLDLTIYGILLDMLVTERMAAEKKILP